MGKFKCPLLFLICVFVQLFDHVQPQLNAPFGVTFHRDIGEKDNFNHFFQYSTAIKAFTRIYGVTRNSRPAFAAGKQDSFIDMNSIIYRTHHKKAVMFHYENSAVDADHLPILLKLLKTVDRQNNIHKVPILNGPCGGFRGISVDGNTTLQAFANKTWSAKIAYGFSEFGYCSNSTAAYTEVQLSNLQQATMTVCYPLNSTSYIALDAFRIGEMNSTFWNHTSYYAVFFKCKLVFYLLPFAKENRQVLNVRNVRKFIDTVNMDRMELLIPGRSIQYRLYSKHNIHWAFCKGHANLESNYDYALLQYVEQGATIIRMDVWQVIAQKDFPMQWAFTNATQQQFEQKNYRIYQITHLSQVIDYSRIAMVRPVVHENIKEMNDLFMGNQNMFIEYRCMKGPNPHYPPPEEEDQKCTQSIIGGRNRAVFSFHENAGKYEQRHLENLAQMINARFSNGQSADYAEFYFGVMVELGFIDTALNWSVITNISHFRYLFLKTDFTAVDGVLLANMDTWIQQFDDYPIYLVFNEQDQYVNMVYNHYKRPEPKDTSGDNYTSKKPETTPTVPPRTPTTPPVIVPTTTPFIEPTPVKNTTEQTKSQAVKMQKRMGWWWNTAIGGVFVFVFGVKGFVFFRELYI